jgi:DNA-binding transcriptional regulator YiaG
MTESTYESAHHSKPVERILRTDVLGRVQTPADLREAILDEFEKSGLSGTKFAKTRGIKYPTFATWIQERRKVRGQYPDPVVAQVSPEASLGSTPLWDGTDRKKSFTFVELIRKQSEPTPPTQNDGGDRLLLIELGDNVKIHVQNDQHILLVAKLIKSLS